MTWLSTGTYGTSNNVNYYSGDETDCSSPSIHYEEAAYNNRRPMTPPAEQQYQRPKKITRKTAKAARMRRVAEFNSKKMMNSMYVSPTQAGYDNSSVNKSTPARQGASTQASRTSWFTYRRQASRSALEIV